MRFVRSLILCAAVAGLGWPAWASAAQPVPFTIDANQATEAQLDGLRGLGPATTRRILAARAEQPFDGWPDLIARVRGIGPALAARLSQQGLTVAGQTWESAAPQAARAAP